MNRLVSRSLLWSVQAVLSTHTITVIASNNSGESVKCHTWELTHELVGRIGHGQRAVKKNVEHDSENSLFIVSLKYIKRLIQQEMPMRDRLVIELALWQALRTHEIGTLRAEWVDLANGIINVLDSKKHRLFPEPLNRIVGPHIDEYENQTGRKHGILLGELHGAKRVGKKGLCNARILRICYHWSDMAGIPRQSPRDLRATLACICHYGKSPMKTANLKTFMRHTDVQITFEYLEHLADEELLHADYEQSVEPYVREFYGQAAPSPFSLSTDECVHKGAACWELGCHCRMFKPMEVRQ